MPREYSMGGRAGKGGQGRSEVPPKQSLRERFSALRNLPPFLLGIWRTSPWLCIWTIVLRLARALLPVVTLYVGKLIIDEVTHLIRAGGFHGGLSDWLADARCRHARRSRTIFVKRKPPWKTSSTDVSMCTGAFAIQTT